MHRFLEQGFLCVLAVLVALTASAQPAPNPLDHPTKPVVLIFVRTTCPISSRYAPTIRAVVQEYQGRADFWLVFPDPADTPSVIHEYLQQYGYQMPALADAGFVLAARSKATITPEAAVFDRTGKLQYHGRIDNLYENFGRARRAASTHELDDAIAAVLAGKPLPVQETTAIGCYISDLK